MRWLSRGGGRQQVSALLLLAATVIVVPCSRAAVGRSNNSNGMLLRSTSFRFLKKTCQRRYKRCRPGKKKKCCDGLFCKYVTRIRNRQGVESRLHRRCVSNDDDQTVIGHYKFQCASELERCKGGRGRRRATSGSSKCCEGLSCHAVDRYVNRQGGKKSELRCINPNKAVPILGKCISEGSECNDNNNKLVCCGGLGCSAAAGRRGGSNNTQRRPAGGKCVALASIVNNSTISPFNKEILKTYRREDELEIGIAAATEALIHQVLYESSMAGARPGPGPVGPDPVGDEIDDFGTNNQEDQVEEGDVIVSDGEYVYAAYADHIAIWNPRTLEMVDTVQMPAVLDSNRRRRRRLSRPARSPGVWYRVKPRATIRHLVLDGEDRLLVVVDGYKDEMLKQAGVKIAMIRSFLATRLRLYQTSSSGKLQLLKETNVHGDFQELRVINGKAHVMTTSSVRFSGIDYYAERGYLMDTNEKFRESLRLEIEEEVELFTGKLLTELRMQPGGIPELIRINTWQEQAPDLPIEDVTGERFNPMEAIALIHTLDMHEEGRSITVSSSGAFMPGKFAPLFYGNSNTLIVAARGYNSFFRDSFWTTIGTTFLVAFQVDHDNARTIPHSVGRVDGDLLNNHAIDVVDDILRIGTSINRWWRFPPGRPSRRESGSPVLDTEIEAISRTENYVILLRMPGLRQVDNDGDGVAEEEEPGIMQEIARLDLGLPNELFTALRFFDDVGYAVTFERTGPLYVIDFSNSTEPNVTAALKITGFSSSYLHSMNADNSLILAVGQAADDRGRPLGVALTVFDVSDLSNPKPAQRYVVEQDLFADYSFTDMESDFKSGRYIRQLNRLVIPLSIYSYGGINATDGDFSGFVSFFVSENEIREECRISHGETSAAGYCYYCAWFPPRSMIFDGNAMTVKDHFVKSTDMDTCQAAEEGMEVIIEDKDDCCTMWY